MLEIAMSCHCCFPPGVCQGARNATGQEQKSCQGPRDIFGFFIFLASFFQGEKIPYWAEVNGLLLRKRDLILFV